MRGSAEGIGLIIAIIIVLIVLVVIFYVSSTIMKTSSETSADFIISKKCKDWTDLKCDQIAANEIKVMIGTTEKTFKTLCQEHFGKNCVDNNNVTCYLMEKCWNRCMCDAVSSKSTG
jgi:hypothetical protein